MSEQSDLYFLCTARAQRSNDQHNADRGVAQTPLSYEDRCSIAAILAYGGIVGFLDGDGVGHEIGNFETGMQWADTGYYRLVWPMGGGMDNHPIPLPWMADETEESQNREREWRANRDAALEIMNEGGK